MNKRESRRNSIFNKYKNNINLLNKNNIIKTLTDIYICPICLNIHKNINGDNPLSLEDVPPKSLGGTSNILTCKSCNNILGHSIDYHLTNYFEIYYNRGLNNNTRISMKVDGINGEIRIGKNGKMELYYPKKTNNPQNLENFINNNKKEDIIDVKLREKKFIREKALCALLKSAYLKLFELTGYSVILDCNYNIIREQLKNNSNNIIDINNYVRDNEYNLEDGCYLCVSSYSECFIIVLTMFYCDLKRSFMVYLPTPIHNIYDTLYYVSKSYTDERDLSIRKLNLNYINDIDDIIYLNNFIIERKLFYFK